MKFDMHIHTTLHSPDSSMEPVNLVRRAREIGLDGVVITDGLYMEGISKKWDLGEATVLSLLAGNDMILGPNGSYQMTVVINAIKAALQSGRLPMARIDESATRIISLKLQRHIMPTMPPQFYGLKA